MLLEQLSTGISSLLAGVDKLSVVIEVVISTDGRVSSDLYRAITRNKAQLTYDAVGAWLPPKRAILNRDGAKDLLTLATLKSRLGKSG